MSEYVEIEDAMLVRSTAMAGHYRIDGEKYWLPWSGVEDGSVDTDGETGTLYLAEWLAMKEGLA